MKCEKLGAFKTLLVLVFFVIGLWYLIWRSTTLSHDVPIFSWAIYLAEIYGFISASLHIFMTWRLTDHQSTPPLPGLKVDVFIPTYNEPIDIVRKTLLAAKHMDYPHETWLLDDGKSNEMEALAKRLEVRYVTRENNEHAKAGNLNNALIQSQGEFIAIFDADHAPQKNFLMKTLGFFSDTQVAFVQTPQDFFNLDSFQHRWNEKKNKLWTEQSLFFKVIQRGKDYWNAAFFCGSCAVVRRKALDQIGGFATDTITEDLHTSIKLHKAGFRSIYLSESLAYGIAPATIAPFLHQRIRWGQGAMQVLRKENIFFTRQLTLAQRLNYLASMLTYFDGWQKGLFYIAPVIVLISGALPLQTTSLAFAVHFIPYFLLSIWVFEEVGRGYGGMLYTEQYNFSRFAAFAWATLSFFAGTLKFKVTSKVRDNGTSSKRLLIPQFAILILNVFAVPTGLIISDTTKLPFDAILFNIFWALVNIAVAIAMLSYTRKTQAFLRNEYRFPIPLPIRINENNNDFIATIDNISSTGCRIYGHLPSITMKGGMVLGKIYLPSGSVEIQAKVVSEEYGASGNEKYLKAVGCQFIWGDQKNQDKLDLFLYGTDMQVRLLEIHEGTRAPMQWFEKLTTQNSLKNIRIDEHWASFCFTRDREELLEFGLIPLPSNNSFPRKIITFAPLILGAQITTIITTRTLNMRLRMLVTREVILETTAGTTYIYSIKNCVTLPESYPALKKHKEEFKLINLTAVS